MKYQNYLKAKIYEYSFKLPLLLALLFIGFDALEAEAGRCEAALESVKVETDVKRKRVDELEKIMREVEGKRVKESSERVKVAEGRRKGTMDEARERRAERDRKKTALEARLRVAR